MLLAVQWLFCQRSKPIKIETRRIRFFAVWHGDLRMRDNALIWNAIGSTQSSNDVRDSLVLCLLVSVDMIIEVDDLYANTKAIDIGNAL